MLATYINAEAVLNLSGEGATPSGFSQLTLKCTQGGICGKKQWGN